MKKIRKNSVGQWCNCLACGRKFGSDGRTFVCPSCFFWWTVDRTGLVFVFGLGHKKGFLVPEGCLLIVKEAKR